MRITAVHITQNYTDKGYDCNVSINGKYGEIKLNMPEDRVQQIVDVVADLIVDAAGDVANNLTRQAMERTAIEHKP